VFVPTVSERHESNAEVDSIARVLVETGDLSSIVTKAKLLEVVVARGTVATNIPLGETGGNSDSLFATASCSESYLASLDCISSSSARGVGVFGVIGASQNDDHDDEGLDSIVSSGSPTFASSFSPIPSSSDSSSSLFVAVKGGVFGAIGAIQNDDHAGEGLESFFSSGSAIFSSSLSWSSLSSSSGSSSSPEGGTFGVIGAIQNDDNAGAGLDSIFSSASAVSSSSASWSSLSSSSGSSSLVTAAEAVAFGVIGASQNDDHEGEVADLTSSTGLSTFCSSAGSIATTDSEDVVAALLAVIAGRAILAVVSPTTGEATVAGDDDKGEVEESPRIASKVAVVVVVAVTMEPCARGSTTAGVVVVGAFLDSSLTLPVAVVEGGTELVARTMGDLPGDRTISLVGDPATPTLFGTCDETFFRRKRILLARFRGVDGVVNVHDRGSSDSNSSAGLATASSTTFSSLSSAATTTSDLEKEGDKVVVVVTVVVAGTLVAGANGTLLPLPLSLPLLRFMGGFGFVGRGGENDWIEMTRITSNECLLLLLELVAGCFPEAVVIVPSSCPSANTISSAMVVGVPSVFVVLVVLMVVGDRRGGGDDDEGGDEEGTMLLPPLTRPPPSRRIRLARDDEVVVVGTTRTTPNDEELVAMAVIVVDFCCCCCCCCSVVAVNEASFLGEASVQLVVVVVVVVVVLGVILVAVVVGALGGGGGGVTTTTEVATGADDDDDDDGEGDKDGTMTRILSNVGVLLESLGVVAVAVVEVDSNKTHSLDGSLVAASSRPGVGSCERDRFLVVVVVVVQRRRGRLVMTKLRWEAVVEDTGSLLTTTSDGVTFFPSSSSSSSDDESSKTRSGSPTGSSSFSLLFTSLRPLFWNSSVRVLGNNSSGGSDAIFLIVITVGVVESGIGTWPVIGRVSSSD
jgi:hypothetical protein